MNTLTSISPSIAAEISSALTSIGRGNLVPQLVSCAIERCSYDDSVNAGYIYFVQKTPVLHNTQLAAPVSKTLPFLEYGFNIDVDHDGNIFGIEFLDRIDFITALRNANAI